MRRSVVVPPGVCGDCAEEVVIFREMGTLTVNINVPTIRMTNVKGLIRLMANLRCTASDNRQLC